MLFHCTKKVILDYFNGNFIIIINLLFLLFWNFLNSNIFTQIFAYFKLNSLNGCNCHMSEEDTAGIDLEKKEEATDAIPEETPTMTEHETTREVAKSSSGPKTWASYKQKLCFVCPETYSDNFWYWCLFCCCCCACVCCFCCEFVFNWMLKSCCSDCDPICYKVEECLCCWHDCSETCEGTCIGACCIGCGECAGGFEECVGCVCDCAECLSAIQDCCGGGADCLGSCCEGIGSICGSCCEVCGSCLEASTGCFDVLGSCCEVLGACASILN